MKILAAKLTALAVALISVPSIAAAKQVAVDVSMAQPVMSAGSNAQTTTMKVGLTGFELPRDGKDRAPVNIAIVLDKSGSMSGEKLPRAKAAAKMAIKRLNSNDIVSIIAYDHNVQVLVPATKVSDRAAMFAAIDSIQLGGNTALFAGVSKGANEVRKFHSKELVNRIILLSDGQANVGPKSPGALGNFGASLAKEGIRRHHHRPRQRLQRRPDVRARREKRWQPHLRRHTSHARHRLRYRVRRHPHCRRAGGAGEN